MMQHVHMYAFSYMYNNGDDFRINRIKFSFKLSTFLRDKIIENKASVHAEFHVQITLTNDLYSSMTVDTEVISNLRRYCGGSFREDSTIVDILIIESLILSSLTYIHSVYKTTNWQRYVLNVCNLNCITYAYINVL